jgi:ribonuclease P protein component
VINQPGSSNNSGIARSYSLGREKRVRKRKEFLKIQSEGRKWKTDHFLVVVSPAEGETSRLGVTITRKVHKRAVRRNLTKRRIKEVFRRLYHFIQNPVDIVVIAHKGAVDVEYLEVKRELNYALRRLGVLEDKRNKRKEQENKEE